ncbi:MAG: cytochrome B6, partial [Terrimicrobiaceae bacterium]
MKPGIQKLADLGLAAFDWLDDRVHIRKVWESTVGHHVPQSAGSWFYVFGSATLLCLMMQLVTGTMLALVYVPSADEAYATLEYLTYHQTLGWFLRALHYWGSDFMVGIMCLHMTQVFLWG